MALPVDLHDQPAFQQEIHNAYSGQFDLRLDDVLMGDGQRQHTPASPNDLASGNRCPDGTVGEAGLLHRGGSRSGACVIQEANEVQKATPAVWR
ncbi:hypothetical protein [Arthrobacter bambusae]|uniref:hypothetical protein n=1 Tax=Arthrobacter bambusae TaxID=1338426 RepID=UPI002786BDFD|nr:hypothetical protein [Arthrobacter bambusae]MDQ0212614.1 hypothetical protein [Arthrobacter bambusae]MDQ0236996.1 hypothetical protein [Arthrobacter bambusae]